jgi:hypothetical protein
MTTILAWNLCSFDFPFFELSLASPAQYGHSQSEKKLGFGDKNHRIKVHT